MEGEGLTWQQDRKGDAEAKKADRVARTREASESFTCTQHEYDTPANNKKNSRNKSKIRHVFIINAYLL